MKERPVMMKKLDAIDYQIIHMLQKNARASAKEISDKVLLSSTAVAARIDRLMQRGIITGFTVRLHAGNLGYKIRAFISLKLDLRQNEVFMRMIQDTPNVVGCHSVTGEYDILIEVIFRDTVELDAFIGSLQTFGPTKTRIVFSSAVDYREEYIRTGEEK